MRSVKRLCAILAGVVLFVAGLLKLMDPVGAGLVVGEYYNFLHIGFLAPSARFVAVAMALLETLLGAAMICGVFPRIAGGLAFVVLGAFTVLTLVMWILNPPMDCGCFGEAVHLTHFQSFIKNVALLLLCFAAYVPSSSL